MKTEKVKVFENKRVLATYIICNVLTLATLIGAVIFAFTSPKTTINKMWTHIGMCAAAIIFFNVPLFARMKLKLRIPPFLQITITLFAIAHFVFGEIYRLYDDSVIFDKILHTVSGVMFGICGFSLVNALNGKDKALNKLSPFFVTLFAFCFSLAIGYVWEIMEYSADSIMGINAQRWQDSFYTAIVNGEEKLISNYGQGNGLIDTMGDMIVNLIGTAVITLIGYVCLKTKSSFMDKIIIMKLNTEPQLQAGAAA